MRNIRSSDYNGIGKIIAKKVTLLLKYYYSYKWLILNFLKVLFKYAYLTWHSGKRTLKPVDPVVSTV